MFIEVMMLQLFWDLNTEESLRCYLSINKAVCKRKQVFQILVLCSFLLEELVSSVILSFQLNKIMFQDFCLIHRM